MTCSCCRKRFETEETRCPHCGEPNPESGLFKTSAVLISAGGTEGLFHSVDDIPGRLRSRLLKSTNGSNSATILIAERRGRREIARGLRHLGPAQRRLAHAMLGGHQDPGQSCWLTPNRKRALAAFIAMVALAVIAFAFTWHWH